ncbi:MAG TPA: flavin reductase family protein [Acidimicrobiales bacterium]
MTVHGSTGDPASDADTFDRLRRRVLWALPTGLFVVGSRAGGTRNLMTANWVMQIATSPKLVAVAVESDSVTRDLIERGGSFSVSLLARSDRGLVRRFVKPARDVVTDGDGVATSIQGEPVFEVGDGLPCLRASVAWLACSLRSVATWDDLAHGRDAGPAASHVLVVGEVADAGETERLGALGDDDAILTMTDTRMNYGG